MRRHMTVRFARTAVVIYDGKMHEIEAMGFTLPLYSNNGWSPFIK